MEEIHIPDRTFPFRRYHSSQRESLQDFHVDHTECCSSDVGLEDDDDDPISMYIDLEKLDEQQGIAGNEEDGVLVNGGGFLVQREDGGGKRRKRKEDKHVQNQTRRKKPRHNEPKPCCSDGGVLEPRKPILAEELAELWTVDPKRARRILANRQSAARSKEKKARYTLDLEGRVKLLHAKTIELNSQLAQNQKEITDLVAEKSELKPRLQAMELQVQVCDAKNEELQLEIERLKTAIGETDYSGWLTEDEQEPHASQPIKLQFGTSSASNITNVPTEAALATYFKAPRSALHIGTCIQRVHSQSQK